MNQARSDKDHPLRIAGLLDRAFAARDLLDAVDAVERLIENAHPLLPGDDHA